MRYHETRPDEKIVVVVDDNETVRKTFFMLLHEKYRVYLAKDGREALQRFRAKPVNLIITGWRLPHINGLDMIARFRESGFEGEAILMSAYPDQVDQKQLDRFSVGDFLVKPLDLQAIEESIHRLLADGPKPKALDRSRINQN